MDVAPLSPQQPDEDNDTQGDFSRLIRGEKVRLLYKNLLPSVLPGNLLVSAALAYGVWDHIEHSIVLTWVGFIYLLTFVRIPLYFSYTSQKPEEQNKYKWGHYFTLSSFLSGVLWGISGIIFFVPNDPAVLSFVTIILLGMIAASTTSLSSHTPAHYAFVIPAVLPLTYSYMTSGLLFSIPLGLLTIIFMGINMIFSRNVSRTLQESIELRFKNDNLVTKLTIEKEKAEAASKAKSRFLASASHDLRQPLHALGLFVGAMELHPMNNDLLSLVDKTKQSYSALEDLLDVLLDISKLDAGVIQPKPETIFLQQTFDNLHQEFEDHARSKGLTLRFHPTRLLTVSDPTLLSRILRNLISNAIRYTDSGAILIGCRYKMDSIIIEVRDSGRGIPEEKQTEIFKEFRQIDNPERDRSKGLGLGLAIVDRLSYLLEHQIEVISSLGKGSIFKLRVPIASTVPDIPASPQELTISDKLTGLKILAIDDESSILDGMKHLLTGWGCSITVAESCEQACAFLKSHNWKPDIILADYRLRDRQTGAEAIKKINQCLGTDTPAIIITGDTAPDRIQEAKKSGYPLLHKPIQPARLRSVLQQQVTKLDTRN